MDSVLVKPRLDTVLVVWLSNRSGSVPGAAVSFFRQRFSSICSRYSSSCCMGRLFRSFAQSCEPLRNKKKHYVFSVSNTICWVELLPRFLLQLSVNREVLTSTRKSSKKVQKKMNLSWRQQNKKCVNVPDNIQLKLSRKDTPDKQHFVIIFERFRHWEKHLCEYLCLWHITVFTLIILLLTRKPEYITRI